MKFLASQEGVSQDGMAAIGYCFGGSIVLQMAIDRVEGLVAVASFHGSLGLDYSAPKEPVTARVLVCNGAADVFIPQEQIDAFQEEMKARKAEMKFVSLPGAKHSFTNPDADRFAKEFGMDIAYQKKADEDSWAEMKALFAGVFAR
jgi:dienelactone hydrolase